MSAPVGRTVKRLDELVTDDFIDSTVQKYSLGKEVWWQRMYGIQSRPVIDQATKQVIGQYSEPIMSICLGMRGALLGPENYIWWFVNTDGNPDTKKIENDIMAALENMRARKAAQTNGAGSPFRKKS